MINLKVRDYAKKNKVALWEIANKLNISEPTMTRKLRKELTREEIDKIKSIIDEIVNDR